MIKFLLIGSRGTLGAEFAQLIPAEQLILGDRPKLDITNNVSTVKFVRHHRPNIVINCSGYTNVDGAETDFDTAMLLNSYAVENLAIACQSINATLVHFSTGMVFPGSNPDGYDETATPSAVNKYGESKLSGEQAIQAVGGNYFIIRTEWLYGRPITATAKKSFIEMMITLGKSGKVKGVIDEIGKPTWAKDLAVSVLDLLANRTAPKTKNSSESGVYHLANEGHTSRFGWAQEIYKILNMDVECEKVRSVDFARPAPRPQYELINNTRLPKLRSWQEALQEYLNTFK